MTPADHPRRAALRRALLDLDEAALLDLLAREGDDAGFADTVLSPVLVDIGRGWEGGELALSQVFMAGRILERALAARGPVAPAPRQPGVIALGVLGDHHGLGKSIVRSALACAGHDVRDLGFGLSPAQLVEGARAQGARVLMVSVLMLRSALRVREVRTLLATGPGPAPHLVVGGAPFAQDPELWREVGADAGGASAADALRLARTLLRTEAA